MQFRWVKHLGFQASLIPHVEFDLKVSKGHEGQVASEGNVWKQAGDRAAGIWNEMLKKAWQWRMLKSENQVSE